jgi:hypothetical protein
MTGDGRMDLIFSSNPVTDVCIFRNECGKPAAGVALGTGDNVTLY